MAADHIALIIGSGMVTAVAVWFTNHRIDWRKVATWTLLTIGCICVSLML